MCVSELLYKSFSSSFTEFLRRLIDLEEHPVISYCWCFDRERHEHPDVIIFCKLADRSDHLGVQWSDDKVQLCSLIVK